MAITLIQQPGFVSFAANPIIFKAKTTLEDKTMLRIVLTCEVHYAKFESTDSGDYQEDYTYFLGDDKIGTFNVAPTLWALIRRRTENSVNNGNLPDVENDVTSAFFRVTAQEVYVEGINEIKGGSVTSETFVAITGGMTDWEWMSASTTDAMDLLKSGRLLSRKPEGEMLIPDMNFVVPLVSGTIGLKLNLARNGETIASKATSENAPWIPMSLPLSTSGCEAGDELVVAYGTSSSHKVVVNKRPEMKVFYFLNGFGLPESVIAYSLESLNYKIESETYNVPQEIEARGYSRVMNFSEQAESEYGMSSGFVSREWAEWWIHEFLPTRMAWMIENGVVVPVAIEPEKTVKLYDKSKPDMMSITFTVRYSFRGGTYNKFE